jgi:hypothetical protein
MTGKVMPRRERQHDRDSGYEHCGSYAIHRADLRNQIRKQTGHGLRKKNDGHDYRR